MARTRMTRLQRGVLLFWIIVLGGGLAALILVLTHQQTTDEAQIGALQTKIVIAKTQTTLDATVTALQRQVQELHPGAVPEPFATLHMLERIAAFAAIPLFLVVVGYSAAVDRAPQEVTR